MTDLLNSLTLDQARPHGIIFPPHEGAHFEQDGFHFTHDGKLLVEKLSKADHDRAEKMIKARQLREAADAAEMEAKAAGAADGFTSTVKSLGTDNSKGGKTAAAKEPVDLQAWLNGKGYRFSRVAEAAREKHSIICSDAESLRDALFETGQYVDRAAGNGG